MEAATGAIATVLIIDQHTQTTLQSWKAVAKSMATHCRSLDRQAVLWLPGFLIPDGLENSRQW